MLDPAKTSTKLFDTVCHDFFRTSHSPKTAEEDVERKLGRLFWSLGLLQRITHPEAQPTALPAHLSGTDSTANGAETKRVPSSKKELKQLQQTFDAALQQHQAGKFAEAEQGYATVLKWNPQHEEALHLLGVLAYQQGRHRRAFELIQRAIAINPAEASYHNNLGNVLQELNQFPQAVESYQRALRIEPRYVEAHNNLANTYKKSGKLPQAVDSYRAALRIKPDVAQALCNLGTVQSEMKDWEAAIQSFQQALELAPHYVEALNNLGNAYKKLDRLLEAADCYSRASVLRPEMPVLYLNLGRIYLTIGDNEKSAECLRRGLSLAPNVAETHQALGHVLKKLGKSDEALQCFETATQLNPADADVRLDLGNALSELDRLDEALEQYRTAAKLEPDNFQIQASLGDILKSKRELSEALDAYRKALEIKPEVLKIHSNYAHSLLMLGERESAIAEFNRVLEQTEDGYARHMLACLNGSAGEPAPTKYVEELFDEYSDRYDVHMVERLRYQAPQLLQQSVAVFQPPARGWRVLDIGCGTGLCGPLFRDWASHLVGVDLAPKMLEQARQRGLYDELLQENLFDVLDSAAADWHLIIAADVLIYLGRLESLMASIHRALLPGGLFAFTVELHSGDDLILHNTGRYAHAEPYIRRLSQENQLEVAECRPVVVRYQMKEPVSSQLYVLRKP